MIIKSLLVLVIACLGYLVWHNREQVSDLKGRVAELRRDLTNFDKAQVSDHQRQQEDILIIDRSAHNLAAWLQRVDDDVDPGYFAMLETMIRRLQKRIDR